MIPPEYFIPVLHMLLGFVVVAYAGLYMLLRAGLRRKFPRVWEYDQQLRKDRWKRRRVHLLNLFQ